LKAGGDRPKLVKRVTKHYTKIKESADTIALDDRIADSIGPTLTSDQAPGTIRRFYAQNFNKLDQFDRLFYEIRPLKAVRRWESYFVWSLLHTSLINARSAYCHAHQRRVSFAEFLLDVVDSFTPLPVKKTRVVSMDD